MNNWPRFDATDSDRYVVNPLEAIVAAVASFIYENVQSTRTPVRGESSAKGDGLK